jgi:hypothetical protein
MEKKEQKYQGKIKKCPVDKEIRDYELKYEKIKQERQKLELQSN